MARRTLILAIAATLGLGAAQFPEYAQQYRQRLGGAIDELQTVIARFDADARQEGLDRDQALTRLDANSDPLAQRRAADMRATVARHERLRLQREDLQEAGPVARLAVFASAYDPPIAGAAWRDFEMAMPVTMEGFVTGAAGALAGLLVGNLLTLPLRRRQRAARAIR